MKVFSTADPPLQSYQERPKPTETKFMRHYSGKGIESKLNAITQILGNKEKYPFIYSAFYLPDDDYVYIEVSKDCQEKIDGMHFRDENTNFVTYNFSKVSRCAPFKIDGHSLGRVNCGTYKNDICEIKGFNKHDMIIRVIPRINGGPPQFIYPPQKRDYSHRHMIKGYFELNVKPNTVQTWSANITKEEIINYFGLNEYINNTELMQKYIQITIPPCSDILLSQIPVELHLQYYKVFSSNARIYCGMDKAGKSLIFNRILDSDCSLGENRDLIKKCKSKRYQFKKAARHFEYYSYQIKKIIDRLGRPLDYRKLYDLPRDFMKEYGCYINGEEKVGAKFYSIEEDFATKYYTYNMETVIKGNENAVDDYFTASDKVYDFIQKHILRKKLQDYNNITPADKSLIDTFNLKIGEDNDDLMPSESNRRDLQIHDLVMNISKEIGIIKSKEGPNFEVLFLEDFNRRKKEPKTTSCHQYHLKLVEDDILFTSDGKKVKIGMTVFSDRDLSATVLHTKGNSVYCVDSFGEITMRHLSTIRMDSRESMTALVPLFDYDPNRGTDKTGYWHREEIIGAYVQDTEKMVTLLRTNNELIKCNKRKVKRVFSNAMSEEFLDSAAVRTIDGITSGKAVGFTKKNTLVRKDDGSLIWCRTKDLIKDDIHTQQSTDSESSSAPVEKTDDEKTDDEKTHNEEIKDEETHNEEFKDEELDDEEEESVEKEKWVIKGALVIHEEDPYEIQVVGRSSAIVFPIINGELQFTPKRVKFADMKPAEIVEGCRVLIRANSTKCRGTVRTVNASTCSVQIDDIKSRHPMAIPFSCITRIHDPLP